MAVLVCVLWSGRGFSIPLRVLRALQAWRHGGRSALWTGRGLCLESFLALGPCLFRGGCDGRICDNRLLLWNRIGRVGIAFGLCSYHGFCHGSDLGRLLYHGAFRFGVWAFLRFQRLLCLLRSYHNHRRRQLLCVLAPGTSICAYCDGALGWSHGEIVRIGAAPSRADCYSFVLI